MPRSSPPVPLIGTHSSPPSPMHPGSPPRTAAASFAGSWNPPYRQFITQTDEDQASAWLKRRLPELPVGAPPVTDPTPDRQIVNQLRRDLQDAGFNTSNPFALIMTTELGRELLQGWTQDRWDQASATQDESNWAPKPFRLAGSDWNLCAPRPLRDDGIRR